MKRCLTPAAKLCSQLADWSTGKVTIATPIVLGRVDGFDQDKAESKRDERAVILRRLLASKVRYA
jgi:hypothetical protein